jgi:hypothetical protein
MQPPPQPSSSSSVPPPNHPFRSPIKQEPSGLPLPYPLTRPSDHDLTHDTSQPTPSDLAETTARLARLERLLSLQDHAYAEKRLKLAEEAVLRLLEVDEVGGSTAELSVKHGDKRGMGMELGDGYAGNGNRDGTAGDQAGMETSSDAEGMGQDENPVELLGDNG